MSKVSLRTKLRYARRAKHRVDMQCKALAGRVRYLEAELEDYKAGAAAEADAGDEARAELRNFNDFWHWLNHGVANGWCSEPACGTHDGIPSTPEEQEAWDDGLDPCEHVLRLWPEDS